MRVNMRVKKNMPGLSNADRRNEHGVIITLVAVFMLFVIGAMAALSIDVVTLYTARSEAQLAADGAALAGARVLANSGATSDTTGASMPGAQTLAIAVATQVAQQNLVGGSIVTSVNVAFGVATDTNPTVTVSVQNNNLPTFFARIWGTTHVTVGASATAEAYNPSAASNAVSTDGGGPPVAPTCVKPWLLPNVDPTQTNPAGNPIFWPSGAIYNPALLGQSWPNTTVANPNPNGLYALCGGNCATGITAPAPGAYYPGATDAADFPPPTPPQARPACSNGFNAYQQAVAGCVQQPISCGANPNINIDIAAYLTDRDADTLTAAECLTHYTGAGSADSIDNLAVPGPPYQPPFQFLGGTENPVAGAVGQSVLVSDSLVTIPVINNPPGTPANPVTVIGFVQVLLNPQSAALPTRPPAGAFQIPAMIINMAGCGTSVTGQPILGNGASPVAVRLISQ
jgi:hypothetical protein